MAFYQASTNSNDFNFAIKSSTDDTYIVNLRRMTTSSSTLTQNRGNLTANTWLQIGSTSNEQYILGPDSWHINIYLKSLDKIFRITVISAAASTGSTASGDQLTLNIQQL